MKKTTLILLLVIFLVPLGVYWPALTTEFGMHNDYRMLNGSFQDRKIFVEADHLYMAGRPMQYYLTTLQSWFIQKMSDFIVFRIVALVFMWIFLALLYRFLHGRLGLDKFWTTIILLCIVMLPPNQLFVIFITELLPGFFTLITAITSYLIFDSVSRRKEKSLHRKKTAIVIQYAISFILFLLSLLTYPINAVFVFACTFAVVLFSPLKEWRQTCKIVIRDIVFFGSGMLTYFLLIVFYFIPNAPQMKAAHVLEKTQYSFNVAFALHKKIGLVIETFLTSLGGTWHCLFIQKGVIVGAVITILSFIFLLYLLVRARNSKVLEIRKNIPYLLIMICVGVVLFLLANAPTIIAKKCFQLVGYRVIFPASVIVLFVQCGFWQKIEYKFSRQKEKNLVRVCAILLVVCLSLVTSKNISDTARNCNLELSYIRKQVASVDLKDIRRILLALVPPYSGETLIERQMAHEFTLMITSITFAEPIVHEVLKKRGLDPITLDIDKSNAVFFDKYTRVIDINRASLRVRDKERLGTKKPFALVSTSSSERRDIEIFFKYGDGISFHFIDGPKERRFPFWLADLNSGLPWFQIDFKDSPQKAQGFTFGVYDINQPRAILAVCRLQATRDGKNWDDLNTKRVLNKETDRNLSMYQITNPDSYKMYRFHIIPKDLSKALLILKIHMVLQV